MIYSSYSFIIKALSRSVGEKTYKYIPYNYTCPTSN